MGKKTFDVEFREPCKKKKSVCFLWCLEGTFWKKWRWDIWGLLQTGEVGKSHSWWMSLCLPLNGQMMLPDLHRSQQLSRDIITGTIMSKKICARVFVTPYVCVSQRSGRGGQFAVLHTCLTRSGAGGGRDAICIICFRWWSKGACKWYGKSCTYSGLWSKFQMTGANFRVWSVATGCFLLVGAGRFMVARVL